MDNGFRVFSVLEDCYEPWSSEPHAVLAWYWQDDECDAPIGPFGSERAAKANYHEYLHHGAPTPQTKDPA